jgi:hypothetical protein
MKNPRLLWWMLLFAACTSTEPAAESTDASLEDVTIVDSNDDTQAADVTSDTAKDADALDSSGDAVKDAAAVCEASGSLYEYCDAMATCDCEAGTVCVKGPCGSTSFAYCAPVPAGCDGSPSCECMGCEACKKEGICMWINDVGITCNTGLTSRRDRKDGIRYVDDAERAALAEQALSIPLASYTYKADPPGSRRRLGFIIDDQPDPSFAVDADRAHVDVYGYASLLLATVQQQQKQIAALEARVATLEKR